MSEASYKSWIELTGLAAIVGSLIFVGLQLKQGQDVEEAWVPFRSQLKGALADPLWAEMFRDNTTKWRESFRNLCFELLAEIEAEKSSSGQ